jgi:hypothetical protein
VNVSNPEQPLLIPSCPCWCQDDGVIESDADYRAIASAALFLTLLSLRLPASATVLPQQMAGLLSACSKLEEAAAKSEADLVLTNLAPLAALGNMQILDIRGCISVSVLAPLKAMSNLKSPNMSGCFKVSGPAPLGALVKLQSLIMSHCSRVSDLAPLTVLVKLQSLNICVCGCNALWRNG